MFRAGVTPTEPGTATLLILYAETVNGPGSVSIDALLALALAVPSTAVADTGTGGGATYSVSTTTIDLDGGWHLDVGQLSGGNEAVAKAFNNASIASGRTLGTTLDGDGVLHDHATLDATPTVSFRPTAVSQVLQGGVLPPGRSAPVGLHHHHRH